MCRTIFVCFIAKHECSRHDKSGFKRGLICVCSNKKYLIQYVHYIGCALTFPPFSKSFHWHASIRKADNKALMDPTSQWVHNTKIRLSNLNKFVQLFMLSLNPDGTVVSYLVSSMLFHTVIHALIR